MSSLDLSTALQLAQASDVAYYTDQPQGATSYPNYAAIGFRQPPGAYYADVINAALVGVADTAVILAFRGTLPINTEDWKAFWDSVLDWLDDADAEHIAVPYATDLVRHGFADLLETLWQ